MSVDLKKEQQKYKDIIESRKQVLDGTYKVKGRERTYRAHPAGYRNRSEFRTATKLSMDAFNNANPKPPVDPWKRGTPEGALTRDERKKRRLADAPKS